EVAARYDRHRIRFDVVDPRVPDGEFDDFRVVKKMEGFSGPYLVVPPYDFKAEVHGDTRLPDAMKGRRTLVPLHPLTELQGPHGDGDTYRPHPGELLAMGLTGPMLRQEGAQVIAGQLSRTGGGFGRFAIVLAVVVFALSTLVGWSELGGRAATAVAGSMGGPVLRLAVLAAAGVGTTWTLAQMLPWVDLAIAAVAVPNLLGLLLMLPRIRAASGGRDDLAESSDS
ncbi:MAG: alanine:cation symporter family protein, partial [Deltaproteobacteria bacterium]|nr:alanine:cation symporter family protein [Deltaproteobacteria bacterium]